MNQEPSIKERTAARSPLRSKGVRAFGAALGVTLILGVPIAASPAFAQEATAAAAQSTKSQVGGIPQDMVEAFLKAAAGKGAGFIFDKLAPNAEAAQLKAISDQITALDARMKALQQTAAALEEKHDKSEYSRLFEKFQDTQKNIDNLSSELSLVGTAATRLAKAKVAYDADSQHANAAVTKEYQDAQSDLAGRKHNFLRVGVTHDPMGNVRAIHNLLYSQAGNNTIVDAYGQLLMAKNQLVNANDSAALRGLYSAMEQYQALGAYLKSEYIIAYTPRGGSPDAELDQNLSEFNRDIDQQRSVLPPSIPAGVVIDVGNNRSTGTAGKPMFYVSGPSQYTWKPGDTGQAGGAVAALVQINTNPQEGLPQKGWVVPSAAQIASVLANPAVKGTPAERLNQALGLKQGDPRSFSTGQSVWESDHRVQSIHYGWNGLVRRTPAFLTFDTHLAATLGATTTASGFNPVLPAGSAGLGSNNASAIATAAFNGAVSRVIAVNASPTEYMALKQPAR